MQLTALLPAILLSFPVATLAQSCERSWKLSCCQYEEPLGDTDRAGPSESLTDDDVVTNLLSCEAVASAADCPDKEGYDTFCCVDPSVGSLLRFSICRRLYMSALRARGLAWQHMQGQCFDSSLLGLTHIFARQASANNLFCTSDSDS
ncbi:hypothetical protein BP00DRAFT_415247 [Aspergillus indologenus CBS 114.80]|uniref:Hydrophobin n=1 Tax=Aspergillus indologenus CBS 114.80 TaxID=1450541 RepID=A0A2V5I6V0_9EURO|nr:hypothetical protein BP00DRAFT_415247 [Aspergillus indologenus CBS 114.80]